MLNMIWIHPSNVTGSFSWVLTTHTHHGRCHGVSPLRLIAEQDGECQSSCGKQTQLGGFHTKITSLLDVRWKNKWN